MEFDSNFWVLVSFLLFVGLLAYFRVPGKVLAALDRRGENIGKELLEAKELRQEAQNLLASWRRRQKEAESEREEILAHANQEAERLVAETRAEMSLYAERQLAMTEARIAQSRRRAEAELRDMAVEAAVQAVRAVLQDGAARPPEEDAVEADMQALAQALQESVAGRGREV